MFFKVFSKKTRLKIYYFILIPLFFSCTNKTALEEIGKEIICSSSNFTIEASDNIVIPDANNPVVWNGSYSDTTVKISFTQNLGVDNETETFNFIFNKIEGCLQINRGYEYYYGSYAGVSALTEVDILELQITEWEVDTKLTGKIAYLDHHDKEIYNRNFWVEFTEDNYILESTEFNYFSECFLNKLPINIDLDNDNNIDYQIIAEEIRNTGNTPAFTEYTIKLISVDENINEILSPKNVNIPFPVIFEVPFSSENTRKYDANRFNSADVKNALDVFYEFDTPYENYNFFLNNNLTYQKEFANSIDDYYLVRLIRNGNYFYGWIKINFKALDCEIDILNTFLNPNPNENVSVD